MKESTHAESVDRVRRKLLRTSMMLGGAFVAGQIPYTRPETKSFFGVRSAWAQASVVYSISCSFDVSLPMPAIPGTACQNAVLQNISVQVTPAPPTGTILRCKPETTDPANAGLLPDDFVGTDAAGKVMFANFDLDGNVPNPPLAIGSKLTMTVAFQDKNTFGTAACSNSVIISAAC